MIALAILTGTVIAATIFAAAWIRTGRDLDNTINEVNAGIDVDQYCCTYGHAYKAKQGPIVWQCRQCGDEVKSAPGWVGPKQ